MKVMVTPFTAPPAAVQPVEIVERKGTGHPDSICDALAEELSIALSKFYLERCGLILHHNVDKGLLWGGATRAGFGGGEVLEPIELFLAGRATREFGGIRVPLEEIAVESTRRWLKNNLRALDPERHVRIHCLLRPSSAALVDLFLRQRDSGVVLANDTSCGVGYAPLDALENMVLRVERHLNSAAARSACPAIGEDIKVMGVRTGETFRLTVACAFIAAEVGDMAAYQAHKARVQALALDAARTISRAPVDVTINAADGDTEDSVYLTVTGTSAEAGDDGEVGRGNRVNGLITPCRPMSMEAAAGKNPVSHVGKLYHLVAGRIARQLVAEIAEITEAQCLLVSAIGHPVDQPQIAEVKVRLTESRALGAVEPRVAAVVRDNLAGINSLWREVVAGKQPVW
jgi:S-adenosylmethionine synthetase